MASEQKNDFSGIWPSDPKNYQWKGTLSVHNGTWNVLAHCKPRKEDVFLKIKQTQDDDSDIDQFTENTKNLINIQHPNLLTPVHAFVHKSEIWVVYPRHSGGPLIEVLTSHYPNGIPDESIVSCILYDICLGLHNLHKQQQCHRNINCSSLHVDIDDGRALLTEFGELKEIKWKHAAGRRNTFVSPEREPFTDPLILFGDESASWYAGDIYAFGITALQLTYGNTPPLNIKNIIQQKSLVITTDLYDKQCPFSKSFELLIKDCCANKLQNRISINKLCEHKFFAKRTQHMAIKQYFGHILKSTEKRINSSLSAPLSFTNYNGMNSNAMSKNNDENIDESNANNIQHNPSDKQQIVTKNGMKIAVEPNGNHTLISNEQNEGNNNNNWTFSTTLRASELNGSDTPMAADTPIANTLSPQHGPTMHNPNPHQSYNDPTAQHHSDNIPMQPTNMQPKKTRSYHVSFSESESMSHDNVQSNSNNQNNNNNNNNSANNSCGMGPDGNNNTVQINRFKVEFGSRLSESGTVATQIEPSETNDEAYDVTQEAYSDDENQQNHSTHSHNDSQSTDGGGGGQQTIKIKRFHITPAKPELSADECDDNININENENNKQQLQQIHAQPQPVQQPQQQRQAVVESKQADNNIDTYQIPQTNKNKWSKQELSEWVGSFGNAFNQYVQPFVDNGIDGEFMGIVVDEELKEIVPSNLHRKKILMAWTKLQLQQ